MKEEKEYKQIREIKIVDLVRYYYLTLLALLCWIALEVVLIILVPLLFALIGTVFMLGVLYVILYYHAIGCVLMYKAYAPMKIRDRCRFEPSCSTYMIMAIRKYGLFRGVIKGLKRIRRCHPPNGGVDYP